MSNSNNMKGAENLVRKQPHQTFGNMNLNMNLSIHRLFTFPNDYQKRTQIEPEFFAEAGFYMAKDYQCICCQFCPLVIKSLDEWRPLTVTQMLEKHHKIFPECPLFTETSQECSHWQYIWCTGLSI